MKTRELIVFRFCAGQPGQGLDALAIVPANAGFFALGLAIFIDLFVLIVAIGAALIDDRREDSFLPDTDRITTEWDARHKQDISDWVEGALLGETRDEAQKMAFAREVLKTIIFNREGNNVLLPLNDEQYRFGVILVKSKAATVTVSCCESLSTSIRSCSTRSVVSKAGSGHRLH